MFEFWHVTTVIGAYLVLFFVGCGVVRFWMWVEDRPRKPQGPIGHITEVREDATGLYVTGTLDTNERNHDERR